MSRTIRPGRRTAAALAVALVLGAAGCGPSAAEIQHAQAQAAESNRAALRAQVAAEQARQASAQAAIAADQARQAVDDATREINRVADHIDQMNRANE
ncbi:MAG: hypothetical protein IVW56_14150 [Candidatus Binataceae bacterium]|nr:hypothetical protein [Candidatus Binataceae bacterium]